ncbi:ribonuclease H-like domain-containing protein [Tanacetum coccineum]|uniref:Ribonuclease H-like domain-containing protein n=1 Tax=Tanacetum coccineum TaxID=301880 RepID=A0ABQ4ZMB8_9ASTR
MCLFRHKYLADGTLSRYKARFIENGSTQLEGIDVDKTFSPVFKPGTIRIVLSLARSLYGLKHAPKAWHGLDIAHLLLYVDDIVLTASFQPLLQRIIASLHQDFSMTDMGSLNYFLGISVTRDSSRMFLSQKKYDVEILERAHMANCNPSRTPVDTESILGDHGDPAGCPTTRRFTSGYCVFLGNNLLFWSIKRQPTISHSSAEAEYRGVINDVAETFQHQLTKHIEIDIHFVRDLVAVGQVCVLHVPSRYQFADIFTKGLPSALFEEFRTSLSIRCPPALTAELVKVI